MNSFVGKVEATDADSSPFNVVRYSIKVRAFALMFLSVCRHLPCVAVLNTKRVALRRIKKMHIIIVLNVLIVFSLVINRTVK